jgi:hypothetical protein
MFYSRISPPLQKALQALCIISFFLALIMPDWADGAVSVTTGGRPDKVGSGGALAPLTSLPARIIGNNRLVVGFSFKGFNLKKISPYFSADIQDTGNPSFHAQENHHVYSGIILLGIGKLTHKRFLKTLGTVLIVDDLMEHTLNIKSALGFVADKIDHGAYVQITSGADGLFGKH